MYVVLSRDGVGPRKLASWETEILATPDDKYCLRHKRRRQGSSAFQVLTLNNDTMIFNTYSPVTFHSWTEL